MKPFDFFILALAIFRFTSLIHAEDGPWRVFARFRFWQGVRTTADTNKPYGLPGFPLANVLACPWCIGLWITIVAFGFYIYYPLETLIVCMPFALHGLAMYFYVRTE